MKWYLKVFKQFADFKGRARRKEFWMFTLINMLISIALLIPIFATMNFETGKLGSIGYVFLAIISIYSLAILIPNLAVAARRLHDTNKSGWLLLLQLIPLGGLVILIFCVIEGDTGKNKYGEDPKLNAIN